MTPPVYAVFGLDELPLILMMLTLHPQFGVAGYDGFAVIFLYSVKLCVDQCRNQPVSRRVEPVQWKDGQIFGPFGSLARPGQSQRFNWLLEVTDDTANFFQGILVIITHIIGHAAYAAVGLGAAGVSLPCPLQWPL